MLLAHPAEVHPSRLRIEVPTQPRMETSGPGEVEVSRFVIPVDLPTRNHEQQVLRPRATSPPVDLPADPLRVTRLWRRQKNQVLGVGESLLHCAPEAGLCRHGCVVQEDSQGSCPVPGSGEGVEAVPQVACTCSVRYVTVRDEGCVTHRNEPPEAFCADICHCSGPAVDSVMKGHQT